MFFQKVFHVHSPLAETKRQLGQLTKLRSRLPGLNKAVITADGVAQFECAVEEGLALHAVLVELPTDEANQVLFKSTVGNVRVAGLLELSAIRPEVTEVQLTLEYSLRSFAGRVLDLCTRKVERYVDDSLRALERCLNGEQRFSAPQPQWAN